MAADLWISLADHQLYLSKTGGRNCIVAHHFSIDADQGRADRRPPVAPPRNYLDNDESNRRLELLFLAIDRALQAWRLAIELHLDLAEVCRQRSDPRTAFTRGQQIFSAHIGRTYSIRISTVVSQ